MLSASNIYVQYGERVLLNSVNIVIGDRDKVGLVGRNGAGKSTLLKILAGYDNPQQGSITKPSGATIGFLHQDMMIPKGKTVIEETLTAFEDIKFMELRFQEITHEIETRTDYESDAYMDLITEFSDVNDRLQLMGQETMQAEAERILTGLGFKNKDMQRMTDELSGGWQMRVELAKMLLRKPTYVLLDEPTNHLDIESIIWLETFLKDYEGAVILISHDKQFLDNITKRTVEIELGRIFDYKAAYTKFMEMRKERREIQKNAFDNQQRVMADKQRTIDRFMAKANKTKMAQSMQKQLDKMETVEIDEEDIKAMKLRFPPVPRGASIPCEGKDVVKTYGELNILDHVSLKLDRGDRLAFVGQNGQGKTTLAKILVGHEPCNSGIINIGMNVEIGYYAQNQADVMSTNQTVLQTMEDASPPETRTKLRSILGAFMFTGEDADKKVSVLSGGERARLALACMLLRPINLLILDEPTNHLDMISKDVLKQAIMDYDGTLIVVSHDRDFLAGLTDRTIEFKDKKLYEHLGDVNYFLERRALDNMREVEMSNKAKAAPNNNGSSANNNVLSPADEATRKRVQRNIQQAEKRIEDIEKDIKKLEKQMEHPDFYMSKEANPTMIKHKSLQKDLEKAMEAWEEAQLELEMA
jgi:ATP-binding cassette, subfamily F, member 3